MNNYDGDIIGVFCQLETPWQGHNYAVVVEDYGNDLLVQVGCGIELVVNREEVYFL